VGEMGCIWDTRTLALNSEEDTGSNGCRLVKGGLKITPTSVGLANLEIEVTGMEVLSEMHGMSQL
jgi:hypothetical protein